MNSLAVILAVGLVAIVSGQDTTTSLKWTGPLFPPKTTTTTGTPTTTAPQACVNCVKNICTKALNPTWGAQSSWEWPCKNRQWEIPCNWIRNRTYETPAFNADCKNHVNQVISCLTGVPATSFVNPKLPVIALLKAKLKAIFG